MISREKLDGYLTRLSLTFQEVAQGTWLVSDPTKGLENVLIVLAEPLVIVRTNVMAVPSRGREALFEELLRLNAAEMVHGAYAIDGKNVIIIDTLEADTMDLEELEASLDALGLALAQHYRVLARFRVKD